MCLSEKNIYFSAYGILALPYVIFLATHLKSPLAVIFSAFFIFSFVCFLKQISKDRKASFLISGKFLLLLIILSILVVWLSGIGGYFPQKGDHAWRNAVFRDLVMMDWPVTYQFSEPSKLVYYFNYWLVPAGIAKIFIPFGEKIALEVGFLMLFLWSILWLFFILLLICCKFENFSIKAAVIIFIVFMGFSGLDCIGWILKFIRARHFYLANHLEWWTYCQYSSHFTQVAWVFNQAIPAWLCTILLFNEPNRWNSINCFSFCFVFAPFPAIGFAGIVFFIFACKSIYLVYKKSLKEFFIRDSIIVNMLMFASIVPLLCFFYISNNQTSGDSFRDFPIYFLLKDRYLLIKYILFIILEFGCYAAVLFSHNRCNVLFGIISAELFIFPLFTVISNDFCMRASIPALCILALLMIEFFLNQRPPAIPLRRRVLLAILLAIGMITPAVEVTQSLISCRRSQWRNYRFYTFNRPDALQLPAIKNFLSTKANHSFFFKYLANK